MPLYAVIGGLPFVTRAMISLYGGFFLSRFGPIVPRPFAAFSTWQVVQLATNVALPFLALPGVVAANAGIAIATASAAVASSPTATRRTTLVWSIPFLPFKRIETSPRLYAWLNI